ncbi:hypothetical protein ACH4PU_12910 [Streptomyces sp. NPDC021100]|uniref:hypothetical protein n=1 Tax=Streptomyces sp. NPDC021100 TaxID=3365114 RepID=UPI0037B28EDD
MDQTHLAIEAFFTTLVRNQPVPDGLASRLRDRYERLRTEQRHLTEDALSRHHLAVPAAYRELSPGLPDQELLPLLEWSTAPTTRCRRRTAPGG